MWLKPVLLTSVKGELLTGTQIRCVLWKDTGDAILQDQAGPRRLLSLPLIPTAPRRLTDQQPFTWAVTLRRG